MTCKNKIPIDQGKLNLCWLASSLHSLFFSQRVGEVIKRYADQYSIKINYIFSRLFKDEDLKLLFNAETDDNTEIIPDTPSCSNSLKDLLNFLLTDNTLDVLVNLRVSSVPWPTQTMIFDNMSLTNYSYNTRSNINDILSMGENPMNYLDRLIYLFGIPASKLGYFSIKKYNDNQLSKIQEYLNDDFSKDYDILVIHFIKNDHKPPTKIVIGNSIFILDSLIMANLPEINSTDGHAISAITCNNSLYIVNSWYKWNIEEGNWQEDYILLDNETLLLKEKPKSGLSYNIKEGDNVFIYVRDNPKLEASPTKSFYRPYAPFKKLFSVSRPLVPTKMGKLLPSVSRPLIPTKIPSNIDKFKFKILKSNPRPLIPTKIKEVRTFDDANF